jgi:sugar lactone lactonase YvrE
MPVASALTFQPLADIRCRVGESPVYDRRRDALWFADITGGVLHCVDLATDGHRAFPFDSDVCSLGIAESGRLIVALRHTVGLFDPDRGSFQALCEIEADQPDMRLNDGKVGPDGAFYVGSMHDRPERAPIGRLYRVDRSGNVEVKITGLRTSNGLAFSADGRRMFHADSRGPWVDRWDLDPATGVMSNRVRFATLDEGSGRPDGGATDTTGGYWSAGQSAGCLNRFAADGSLVARYDLPVGAPTMPCFGGVDFRRLFVTSLTEGQSDEKLARYPWSGLTLAAEAPVAGVPVSLFRDS